MVQLHKGVELARMNASDLYSSRLEMAMGVTPSNLVRVAFVRKTALELVLCADQLCSRTTTKTLAASGIRRGDTLIAMSVRRDGCAVAAYVSSGGGINCTVGIAVCADLLCSTATNRVVDVSALDPTLGCLYTPSKLQLVVDPATDRPLLTIKTTSGQLGLVTCADSTCASASMTILPIGLEEPRELLGHVSMDVALTGKPVLTYNVMTGEGGALQMVACNDSTCSGSNTAALPTPGSLVYMATNLLGPHGPHGRERMQLVIAFSIMGDAATPPLYTVLCDVGGSCQPPQPAGAANAQFVIDALALTTTTDGAHTTLLYVSDNGLHSVYCATTELASGVGCKTVAFDNTNGFFNGWNGNLRLAAVSSPRTGHPIIGSFRQTYDAQYNSGPTVVDVVFCSNMACTTSTGPKSAGGWAATKGVCVAAAVLSLVGIVAFIHWRRSSRDRYNLIVGTDTPHEVHQ
jgi:hypothetical protein